MTLSEISITTERLYYLLQTISEQHYEMEDNQRFSLIEIAWEISGEINDRMNTREGKHNGQN
ncbi:hypothetical protein C2U55_25150 [Enterobacteriaceae bacterium ENNIH3]|nr:hypothetical protein C2U55_25150 [Enterobacteriaceae bacterium ENNIH3]AUV10549.1 hypothetical protein C2U52_16955 [Enterobacteriaceae bacterium ENNIH2]